jgi:hypothetical protein
VLLRFYGNKKVPVNNKAGSSAKHQNLAKMTHPAHARNLTLSSL